MEIDIRLSVQSDEKRLLRIFNEARCSLSCFIEPESSLENFQEQIAGEQIYVAEVNFEVVAFVSVWVEDNFIHHLYVLPKYQRYGLGYRLLDQCQQTYGLPLSLKCILANKQACSFYERLGWVAKNTEMSEDGSYNHYWLGHA